MGSVLIYCVIFSALKHTSPRFNYAILQLIDFLLGPSQCPKVLCPNPLLSVISSRFSHLRFIVSRPPLYSLSFVHIKRGINTLPKDNKIPMYNINQGTKQEPSKAASSHASTQESINAAFHTYPSATWPDPVLRRNPRALAQNANAAQDAHALTQEPHASIHVDDMSRLNATAVARVWEVRSTQDIIDVIRLAASEGKQVFFPSSVINWLQFTLWY